MKHSKLRKKNIRNNYFRTPACSGETLFFSPFRSLLLLSFLHSSSMDEVTKQWEKLTLTDIEGEECALTNDVIDGSFAVVVKFFMKQKINLEAVARTFRGVWKADGDFEFRDLGNNRALIVFTDEVDMNRESFFTAHGPLTNIFWPFISWERMNASIW